MDPRIAPLAAGGFPLAAALLLRRLGRPGAAFPLAFAAGFLVLEGPGTLPPAEAWRWLLPLAGACLAASFAEAGRARWPVRTALLAALLGTGLRLLPWGWAAGAAAAAVLGFLLHDRSPHREGWEPGLLAAFGMSCGAFALLISGSQRMGLLGGAMAGAALGGAAPPGAVLLPLLLLTYGAYVLEAPLGPFLVLWALPAAAWIPDRRMRWTAAVLGGLSAGLWAWRSSPPLGY